MIKTTIEIEDGPRSRARWLRDMIGAWNKDKDMLYWFGLGCPKVPCPDWISAQADHNQSSFDI